MNYLNLFRKQCLNGGSASDSKTCDSIRVRELDGSLNIVLG